MCFVISIEILYFLVNRNHCSGCVMWGVERRGKQDKCVTWLVIISHFIITQKSINYNWISLIFTASKVTHEYHILSISMKSPIQTKKKINLNYWKRPLDLLIMLWTIARWIGLELNGNEYNQLMALMLSSSIMIMLMADLFLVSK